MAKPSWKAQQEEKERVVKEREEAEKRAKQEKMASLGSVSAESGPAPIHGHGEVPVNVPDLGLVDKEEAIDTEQRRLMRHVNASESKAQSNKSEAQIKKEEEDARAKAEEQARSDALVAKMQRKMAEHQASSHKPGATSSGLTVMTIEEETDEEARKRQAVANIANFIGK